MISSNAELVVRLHKNDVSAFDALYWEYHQAIYRNILKLTKEPLAAEDILQEVFIKLWEKRFDIDPAQSVAGWLFVISFNLSVNYTRKKLRIDTMHKNLLAVEAGTNQQAGINSDEEQYRLLEKAIEQLSPQKRKVVTLCKLEGKTYDEAAGELKISRNTVKEHLQNAMVNLNEFVRKNTAYVVFAFFCEWMN